MPDILIRDVPEETVAELAQAAERHRRSREKHALFLIEQGLSRGPAETCGELLEIGNRLSAAIKTLIA